MAPLLAQQMPRAERATPSTAAASWMAWLTWSGELKMCCVFNLWAAMMLSASKAMQGAAELADRRDSDRQG